MNNQFFAAMDFKQVRDLFGNTLYILNIVDHGTRRLIYTASTYNPGALWLAQQMREAFPYDTAPKYMLMDRDQLFQPLVNYTLPNMGIKVKQIDPQCPWQNGVVERFILTQKLELLDYITPINERHLDRLLIQFKDYYNYARPHMYRHGYPPACVDTKVSVRPAEKNVRNLKSIKWVGGLHRSYSWAA